MCMPMGVVSALYGIKGCMTIFMVHKAAVHILEDIWQHIIMNQ